ncbi:MAG: hypothetical protein NTV06_09885 [candidate division Zixibacteria bacterium]|nr:hypothetical protein [candidate division Zixibacteria bacterium]
MQKCLTELADCHGDSTGQYLFACLDKQVFYYIGRRKINFTRNFLLAGLGEQVLQNLSAADGSFFLDYWTTKDKLGK